MARSLLALSALALVATPAAAANYTARPAAPPAESRIVVRDVLWACGPASCAGATANGRPLVVCQALAKKAGRIESFLVDGRPMGSAELERCNASAPADKGEAVADAR